MSSGHPDCFSLRPELWFQGSGSAAESFYGPWHLRGSQVNWVLSRVLLTESKGKGGFPKAGGGEGVEDAKLGT